RARCSARRCGAEPGAGDTIQKPIVVATPFQVALDPGSRDAAAEMTAGGTLGKRAGGPRSGLDHADMGVRRIDGVMLPAGAEGAGQGAHEFGLDLVQVDIRAAGVVVEQRKGL